MKYEVIVGGVELQNGRFCRKGDVLDASEFAPAVGVPPTDDMPDGTPWAPAEVESLLSTGHIKEIN
jgi:hypothetical protein